MATIQSGFGPILLAVQQQLRAQIPVLSLNPSLCNIVARDTAPAFSADQDVLVRAGSVISLKPVFDGAGRACTRFKRFILVYPRTRYSVDESVSDEQAVTDTTYGMMPWEEMVTTALIEFWPAKVTGETVDFLTVEPIRVSDGTDPLKTNDKMWGSSVLHFEVEYLFSLNGRPWDPPLITTTSLPDGSASVAYSQALSKVGGTSPYVWTTLGTLPTGLSISSTTGTISGTPTANGIYYFTVVLTDDNGQRAAKSYSVTVGGITITPTTLSDGTSGTAYSQQLSASGGTAPYAFSVTSGSLPSGITLSSAGLLAGTP